MGLSGISPMSVFLIFLIILILFGTKKIRHIGEDLGYALKNFKKSMDSEDKTPGNKNNDLKL